MTQTQRLILIIALVIAVPVLGFFYVSKRYLQPRNEVQRKIAAAEYYIDEFNAYLDKGPRLDRDLRAYAERTLGRSPEVVEHALRSALNDLGARHKLVKLTVDTNMRGPVESPAAAARVDEFQKRKVLRELPDFYRAEATLTGAGSLAQMLATVHDAQNLPWLSRLEVVDISARDNGQRFELRLKLTTPYFRDLVPDDALAASLPVSGALPESLAALATRNVFHLPPPPQPKPEPEPEPVVVAQQPEPPAPAPPPPYQDWQVTAITATASGPELWLVNRQNNQRRVLLVSQQILDATFLGVGADPERALVEIEGQRFEVRLGKTLAERTPAESASVTQSTGAQAPTFATAPSGAEFGGITSLEQPQAGRGPT